MTVAERISYYIARLCEEVGVSPGKIYNPKTNAWYFSNGSATIEVFLTTPKTSQADPVTYLRCMSPLCNIPAELPAQFKLFKTTMAINAVYPGFKIGADESRGIICIIAERNIEGMDYPEMVEMIDHVGQWANKLDDFLKIELNTSHP